MKAMKKWSYAFLTVLTVTLAVAITLPRSLVIPIDIHLNQGTVKGIDFSKHKRWENASLDVTALRLRRCTIPQHGWLPLRSLPNLERLLIQDSVVSSLEGLSDISKDGRFWWLELWSVRVLDSDVIDVSQLPITDFGLAGIHSPVHLELGRELRRLSISGCEIKNFHSAIREPQLQSLSLADLTLTTKMISAIDSLHADTLILSNCDLPSGRLRFHDNVRHVELTNLSQLTDLGLSGVESLKISQDEVFEVTSGSALKEMDLRGDGCQDTLMVGFPALLRLTIGRDTFTKSQIKDFARRHPDVTIVLGN